MTLPMARDLAKAGIRVVSIAPGLFLTPMLEGLPQRGAGEPRRRRCRSRPGSAGRTSSPRWSLQIAENAMLNGTVIRLDGAIRMGPR